MAVNLAISITQQAVCYYRRISLCMHHNNNVCIGEDVIIQDELYVDGAHILHHKNISVSSPDPQLINYLVDFYFFMMFLDVKNQL